MKKIFVYGIALVAMLISCGKNQKSAGDYPDNFSQISDSEKVKYMMERVAPDSLARFIVYSSLGQNPGVEIHSISESVLYAYQNLSSTDLEQFSVELDGLQNSLPLAEKMQLYHAVGVEDPQQFGLKLGLEYLGSIREDEKSVQEIDAELAAFKKACGNDKETYRRFVTGFKTALRADGGVDLPAGVYQKYINMPDE